jgi:hypothetical protein
VLVSFWRAVGGISLVDLDHYAHVGFWKEIGTTAEFCDGLHVDACTDEWLDAFIEDCRSWAAAPPSFFAGAERPRSALRERLDFVSYLRTAVLECAGFPGLLGDRAFEEIRPALLENLPLF